MRRFWLDCRRVFAMPGLPMFALTIGVFAAINAHEGFWLDMVAVLVMAAFAMVVFAPVLALMRMIPWFRRRMDKQWGGRFGDGPAQDVNRLGDVDHL